MRSNYKPIGECIRLVDERNTDLRVTKLLGLSISKEFIPSVANIVGTDMKNYKIILKNQFACSTMQVRRDRKMPVALLKDFDEAIISAAYPVFEVIDEESILPEYMMMWFTRSEFDREACFYAIGGVRGSIEWEDFCNMKLPVPSIEKQREIVKEYHVLVDRINLNNRLIEKLEETAQAIYKHWFVDFEFPDEEGKPYKSNGGEMVFNEELDMEIPKGWEVKILSSLSEMKYGKMLKEDDFSDSGFPVYSGYGIRGFCKQYIYEETQILVIARGVSGTGEVKMSPPKCYVTNLSIVVEVKKNLVNKMYLYLYLKNKNLRSLDSGSAQSQITTNDLNNVSILIPPIEMQNSAGNLIEILKENLDKKNDEINVINKTKDILLSKLATLEDNQ
ncbi:restriction endonuclease subunit S [Acetobacterium wieringae]|uniref:restriction endonuclease subunit S n=1 Tax=Acetobacterium wieringae TaxID=52694 RepID=UPI003159722A